MSDSVILGDVATLVSDKYSPNSNDVDKKCINLEHFLGGTGRISGYSNASENLSIKTAFRSGDILFGKLRPYLKKYAKPNFDGVCTTEVLAFRASEKISPDYLFQIISSDSFITHNVSAVFGTKMPRTDWNIAKSFEFYLPSLDAQNKIAQILTALDSQIEATENLVEKKELQRDGLIQDLMIGGRNWVNSKLQLLAEVVSGGTPSRAVPDYWGGTYPWVTPTDITSATGNYLYSTKEMISEEGLQNSSAKLLPAGTVLMTSRATLGESKIALFPVCTNQGFKSLIPRNGVNSAFLMYQMRRMRGLYSNLGIGTTFLEVNKRDTDNFSIPIPKSEVEQKRISSLFLLMDDEIELEKAVLNKFKLQKQGLMQHLLTGQVTVN